MYKVTLINYDLDDTYYQMRYAESKEDFAVGRYGLREWEEPKAPVKEQYTLEFNTKEKADFYASQDDIQEQFDSVEVSE